MPFLCLALAHKKCVPFKGPSLPQVHLPSFSTTNTGKSGTNALLQFMARKTASSASFPPWNSSLLPKLYNLNEPCHPHLVDIDIPKTLCWHHFVACRAETVGHQHHFCQYLSISSNFQRSKPNQKNSADFIHLASSKLFTPIPHYIPEHIKTEIRQK